MFAEGVLSCSHTGFQMQLSWVAQQRVATYTSLFSALSSHSLFSEFSPSESSHMYTTDDTKAAFLSDLTFTKYFLPVLLVFLHIFTYCKYVR